MSTMRPQGYKEKQVDVDGWAIHLTTYQLGEQYICQADNVSSGARLARISALSEEEAERQVLEVAKKLLSRTKRHPV